MMEIIELQDSPKEIELLVNDEVEFIEPNKKAKLETETVSSPPRTLISNIVNEDVLVHKKVKESTNKEDHHKTTQRKIDEFFTKSRSERASEANSGKDNFFRRELEVNDSGCDSDRSVEIPPVKTNKRSNKQCIDCDSSFIPLLRKNEGWMCVYCEEHRKKNPPKQKKKKKKSISRSPKLKGESKTNNGYYAKEYVVERVVDKRIRDGQVEYLLKWEGWPDSANTWQTSRDVIHASKLIKLFESQHDSKKKVAVFHNVLQCWMQGFVSSIKYTDTIRTSVHVRLTQTQKITVSDYQIQPPGAIDVVAEKDQVNREVLALYPVVNGWTQKYYRARILEKDGELFTLQYYAHSDGIQDIIIDNIPSYKIILRRCSNCSSDWQDEELWKDSYLCQSCESLKKIFWNLPPPVLRVACSEGHCVFSITPPPNWPENVKYYKHSFCGCLRRGVRPEHAQFIEKNRSSWTHVALPSKYSKSYGEIKRLQPGHPAYFEGVSEYGYFATEDTPANTFIGEMTGRWKYKQKKDKSRYLVKVYLTDLNPDFDLDVDADLEGNEMRYVNSTSFDLDIRENVRMETVWCCGYLCIFLYTISDVKKGEEFILNYGNDYFEETHPECTPFYVYVGFKKQPVMEQKKLKDVVVISDSEDREIEAAYNTFEIDMLDYEIQK